MDTIYGLYFDEKKLILEIKPFSKGNRFEGIKQHNDCYYISCDRKLLREEAQVIKAKWIEKREQELEQLKTLKVKNKY